MENKEMISRTTLEKNERGMIINEEGEMFQIWGCFNKDRKTNPFKYGLPGSSERVGKSWAYKDVKETNFTCWESIANTIKFLKENLPGETFTVVFV